MVTSKRGFSLIETIASVVMLAGLMTAITRVSMTKVQDTIAVDQQYAILSADSYLAEIYTGFHNCKNFTYDEIAGAGAHVDINGETTWDVPPRQVLMFVMRDGTPSIFEFSDGDFYWNGVRQFDGTSFRVYGAANNLEVGVKVPNQRWLSINMYR